MLIIPRLWITALKEGIPSLGGMWDISSRGMYIKERLPSSVNHSMTSVHHQAHQEQESATRIPVHLSILFKISFQATLKHNAQDYETPLAKQSVLLPLPFSCRETQETLANDNSGQYAIHHHFSIGFSSHHRLSQHLHTLLRRLLHHRHRREHGKRLLWSRMHSP